MRILIIEDDKEINKLLSVFLGKNGYDTVSSYDGVDGLNALKKYAKKNGGFSGGKSVADTDTNLQDNIDLILLDMMLPGFSGDEILTKIRSFTDIPVIVVSAVSSLDERLFMMKNGADDYIIKPFELPDVLVRIEAVMRRYNAANNRVQADNKNTSVAAPGKKLTYGSIVMDTALMTVSIKGEEVTLTSKEYEILKLMLENQNKLFSKANLYESVWNEEYFPDDQSLKVHMSNLRSKLRRYDEFDYIETIWGMGYRLRKL